MAFGKKYEGSFYERFDTSIPVVVQLWKDGYVGSSSSIPLRGPTPVTRYDSQPNSDEYFPLRPSTVRVDLRSGGSSIIDDIYSDNSDWLIVVTIDGAEDFRGMLIRDGRSKTRNAFGGEYSLTAMCGLGYLKTLNAYTEMVADALIVSQKTIAGWIIWCLDKIGYSFDVYMSSRFYAQGMSGSDLCEAQEYVRNQAWSLNDSAGNAQLSGMSVYDMLSDLCVGSFVHQKAGAWHVYKRGNYHATPFTRYQYSSGSDAELGDGTSDSYTSHVTATDPDGQSEWGGDTPIRDPAREASVTYLHGTVDNLIYNGDFRIFPVPFFFDTADGWTHNGPTAVYEGVVQTPDGRMSLRRALRMPTYYGDEGDEQTTVVAGQDAVSTSTALESSAIDALAVSVRWLVKMNEVAVADSSHVFTFNAYLKITLDTGGTVYYLKRDALSEDVTWETSEYYSVFTIPGNEETEVTIDAPAPPADGDLEVTIYSSYDASGIVYSGGTRPSTYTYCQGIRILPVLNDEPQVIQASTRYVAAVDGGTVGVARNPLETLIGTGPTKRHWGAILDSSGDLVNDYQVASPPGAPTDVTRAEIMAYETLAMTRFDRPVIDAVYTHEVKPSPILAVVEDSIPYLPVYCEYDYRSGKTRVVAVESVINGFTPDYDAVASDSVANITARSGEGQALVIDRFSDHLRNFSEWNALTKTTSNLTGNITAIPVDTLNAEQAVLTAGNFIAVAGLNGGVWEFEIDASPSAPITSIDIVDTDIGDAIIPTGSGVYPGTGDLVSVQSQTVNAIYQSISSGAFATLGEDLDGAAITDFDVSAIPYDLSDGWVLQIGPSTADEPYAGNIYVATLDGAASASATNLTVDSAEIRAKTGDPVSLSNVSSQTEIVQNASEIILRAKRDELIDDINNVSQTSVLIDPDHIYITGLTTFASGYDPTTKSATFRQATAPVSGMVDGDHWFDSDDGDRHYVYDSGWQPAETTIDGGRITTGQIESVDWGAAAGMQIDLTNGEITIGGSSAPDLQYSSGTLTVGGRINPTSAASPSADGFYMGSDYFGLYDTAAWKVLFTSAGNMQLGTGGTSLNYVASTDTLTATGVIEADSGYLNDLDIDGTLTLKIGGELTHDSGYYTIGYSGVVFDGTTSKSGGGGIVWDDGGDVLAIGCNASFGSADSGEIFCSLPLLIGGGTDVIIGADDVLIAGSDENLGFYDATPVALQTGVAVTAAGIHAALVNLGLITA